MPKTDRAARLRPWLLAATVAVFVVPPLLPTESSGRGGEMLPVVMLTVVLAAVWAGAQIGRPRFRIRFQATDIAVLALVGFHTIAAIVATRHGHARPAVNMLWVWIGMGLAYFLLRQLLATAREARTVAVVMIGLAVVLSGYGLWQYAHEFPAMRAAYAKNPDAMLRSQGMWFEPGSPARTQFDNRLASREPLATFALTNSLAGYLAPWLVVAAGIALSAGRRSQRRLCIAASLAGLLIAACLVLTKSRSGYAAAGLGLVLVAFCYGGYRARVPWKLLLSGAMVAAVLIGLALAAGGLDAEVVGEASKSLGYRVQYWQSTARMIAERPLFGCGPGQFQNVYTSYKLPEASEEIAEPHNFLLEVWATAGTPAALAMLAVLACFAWSFVKRKEQREDGGKASSQADASAWVLGGGIAGLLAAWPLGMLAGIPPATAVYVIGASLGIAAAFFFNNQPHDQPLAGFAKQQPRHFHPFSTLAAIAAVVLLVNLLAAGGIGFAGVAGSFWLLLALGLFRESDGGEFDGDSRSLKPLMAPLLAPTLAALLAILGIICYFTAYRPVLNAQSRVQAALSDPVQAEEHLLAAALADPLSAQPWRQLATLSFEAWERGKNRGDLERFKHRMATALELDTGASSAWLMSADRYLDVHTHTKKEDDLKHALAGYHKAVELYPNDATIRAKYALALRIAGRREESGKQAREAIRLDDITPHTDGKIPKPLRQRLIETPKGV